MGDSTQSKVRVIGCRWCPSTFRVTSMLSSNLVPFEFVPVESPQQAAELLDSPELDYSMLPVVMFSTATLFNPEDLELAEQIGLNTKPEARDYYDMLIIGAGPAGLSAAVYAASEGLAVTLLERRHIGGQAGLSARIENYLGFADGISGSELAHSALRQAQKFGASVVSARQMVSIEYEDGYKLVRLEDGTRIACRALLLTTGVEFRRLEAPGVDELIGAGVYYSAPMSEALMHADEEVYVVGGANSAGQAAVALATRCARVTLVVRGDSLEKGMSRYLVESIRRTPNITVMLNSEVVAARGTMKLEEICIAERGKESEGRWLPASVLYLYIGAAPHTQCLQGLLDLDDYGFIRTGHSGPRSLETSASGVFAAGDVRCGSTKRVASAVGEGAMAVAQVHGYLSA